MMENSWSASAGSWGGWTDKCVLSLLEDLRLAVEKGELPLEGGGALVRARAGGPADVLLAGQAHGEGLYGAGLGQEEGDDARYHRVLARASHGRVQEHELLRQRDLERGRAQAKGGEHRAERFSQEPTSLFCLPT